MVILFPAVPVTVEYSITELGKTLSDAVYKLTHWAEEHYEEIVQAQELYDK